MASDTIVAVSSPPGRSARGLIRVDGPGAFAVLGRLTGGEGLPTRGVAPARLQHADLPPLAVLVATFPGPGSYTGSDIVELQLPGHPALMDRVIHAILGMELPELPGAGAGAGVRLAEPGEFTFRAYTAGRLDLTRAEGVAATINAVSDGQLAAAAHLRHGELARYAAGHVARLGRLLALVESGIDFVDQEDVVPIAPRDLAAALAKEQRSLAELLGSSRSWGACEALPRVVLVGPPSAGKSTLFNALLGRPRAVIDAAPGTTRDVLEEPLTLQNSRGTSEVMLIDVAGLDTAESLLDQSIQRQAHDAIRGADLLLVLGASQLQPVVQCPAVRVQNKCDLIEDMSHLPVGPSATLRVSALTGEGVDQLREVILDRLGDRAVSVHAEQLALQPRHESALRKALEALHNASDHVDSNVRALDQIELVAGAMRHALDQLAGLGGQLTPDDVIGLVFATFCVGK